MYCGNNGCGAIDNDELYLIREEQLNRKAIQLNRKAIKGGEENTCGNNGCGAIDNDEL